MNYLEHNNELEDCGPNLRGDIAWHLKIINSLFL